MRDAVQRLLDGPLSKATVYDEEEQEGVWEAIFNSGDVDDEAFFQVNQLGV